MFRIKYFYIEYTEKYNCPEYEESEAHIIQARTKKKAIEKLKAWLRPDGYDSLTIDTIYETSSDARP